MTYTEKALQIVTRQTEVAKRDNGDANHRGVKFTASGRYFVNGRRISHDDAVQHIAAMLETEDQTVKATKSEPRRTDFSWDALNQSTKDFFFDLCEQMQTINNDHDMLVPVAVKELKIGLTNAPRLTNLKRAGLVVGSSGLKKTHKLLTLTDEGRAIWGAQA